MRSSLRKTRTESYITDDGYDQYRRVQLLSVCTTVRPFVMSYSLAHMLKLIRFTVRLKVTKFVLLHSAYFTNIKEFSGSSTEGVTWIILLWTFHNCIQRSTCRILSVVFRMWCEIMAMTGMYFLVSRLAHIASFFIIPSGPQPNERTLPKVMTMTTANSYHKHAYRNTHMRVYIANGFSGLTKVSVGCHYFEEVIWLSRICLCMNFANTGLSFCPKLSVKAIKREV